MMTRRVDTSNLLASGDRNGGYHTSSARRDQIMVSSVDAIYRFIPLVFLGLLMACGAAPRRAVPAKTIQWQSAVDGGYVAGCQQGDQVIAARSHGVERWSFLAGERPKRLLNLGVAPIGDGAVTGLRCDGATVVVETADNRRLMMAQTGLTPCSAADATVCAGVESPPSKSASAPSTPGQSDPAVQWQGALADGRLVVLGHWGRGLRQGDDYVDWRPAPGRLADATFDGRSIWAVGAGGLWRWVPGLPSARPVPLPPNLSGKALTGVFRDGPLLWVRDQDDAGWPLAMRGGVAHAAAKPGALPARGLDSRMQMGDWQIAATYGERGLKFIDAEARKEIVDTPPVTSLLPLDEAHFLVGDEARLTLWTLSDTGPPTRLESWSLGGATLRIFVDGDRVFAVGRPYGIITGVVVPLTEKRTKRSR